MRKLVGKVLRTVFSLSITTSRFHCIEYENMIESLVCECSETNIIDA